MADARPHALVTGGGSGIGAAIAAALAADGCRVTLIGRREAPLRAQAARLPDVCVAAADITDRAQLAAALDHGRRAFGSYDIVVANAGAAKSGRFAAQGFDIWRQLMAVNLDALHHLATLTMDELLASEAGRLIVIASTAGLKGYAYSVAYSAAKHGAIGMVRALALELAKTRVTVNAVCPGFTETEIVAQAVTRIADKTGRSEADARAELASFNPQRRLVAPDEVARVVAWLAAPASRSITGQSYIVAGGEVM